MHRDAELSVRLVTTESREERMMTLAAALHEALCRLGQPATAGAPSVEVERPRLQPLELPFMIPPDAPRAICIEALTPLLLRGDWNACTELAPRAPALALIVRATARRLGALLEGAGAAAPRLAFPELVDTELVGSENLRSWRGSRFSRRQQRRLPLLGVTGRMVVRGPGLGAVVPLLGVAEVFGVGKATTMGFGHLVVHPS